MRAVERGVGIEKLFKKVAIPFLRRCYKQDRWGDDQVLSDWHWTLIAKKSKTNNCFLTLDFQWAFDSDRVDTEKIFKEIIGDTESSDTYEEKELEEIIAIKGQGISTLAKIIAEVIDDFGGVYTNSKAWTWHVSNGSEERIELDMELNGGSIESIKETLEAIARRDGLELE